MNEGVKILIERIKTNPEEFTKGSKWAGVIHGYKAYLSKEDAQALDDAYNGLMQQEFTEKVMKELLAPEEEDDLGKWFTAQKTGTSSGGVTLGAYTATPYSVGTSTTINANSLTLGSTTLDESTLEHMKAHIEALQVKDRKALLKKPHKTLFGKLFNYQ